jgi:catechol 2,3-dioxygenase-like lactoylglutathione lyase family enzyme
MALQHVTIEVKPADLEACIEFFELLGYRRFDPPESLRDVATWVVRDGTHVHFLHMDEPTVPPLAHAAFTVDDWEATVAAIRDAGHEVHEADRAWGAGRAFARMPTGHLVEVMEFPPPGG